MRETFLRPPSGPAEVLADVLRVVGLVSVVIAAIGWGPVKGAVLALALLGLVIPRMLGLRAGFDLALGATVLVAAWSSVFELYVTVQPIDIPIHFALNGLLAVLAYELATRAALVVPPTGPRGRAGAVLVTTAIGALLGVLWEFGEWAGKRFFDPEIFVGYDDTIGDLLVGIAGSVVAGVFAPWLTARQRRVESAARIR